jgi:predicted transcriptional regulator
MKDKTLLKDKTITIRLTPEQAFGLEEVAAVFLCSKSVLIRAAIQYLIDRYYDQ